MSRRKIATTAGVALAVAGLGAWLITARVAYAHCDTLDGPVVIEAKAALEKGDLTAALQALADTTNDPALAQVARQLLNVGLEDIDVLVYPDRDTLNRAVEEGRLSQNVADRVNNRIQIFTPEGRFLRQWTNVGKQFGRIADDGVEFPKDLEAWVEAEA